MPDGPMTPENGEVDRSKIAAQEAEKERLSREQGDGSEPRLYIRPYEALKYKDYSAMPDKILDEENREKREVRETLQGEILGPFWTLSTKIQHVVEAASAKKNLYSGENDLERTGYSRAQLAEQLEFTKGGENETLLMTTLDQVVRGESSEVIFNWALPYLSMAWSGMDSLRLISDRGMQLPMSDLSIFFKGPVSSDLAELQAEHPQVVGTLSIQGNVSVDSSKKVDSVNPTDAANKTDISVVAGKKEAEVKRENEIFMETFAHYTSESYFWTQIRGEMNTYNPAFGEKLSVSKTTQKFIAEFSRPMTKTDEYGETEKGVADSYQKDGKITIFVRNLGGGRFEQIPQKLVMGADGKSRIIPAIELDRNTDRTEELYIDNLDFFNKMKSENERRWVVATTAAMCICNARKRLDGLFHDIDGLKNGNYVDKITQEQKEQILKEDEKKYSALIEDVRYVANHIKNNYDLQGRGKIGEKLAKTAFYMSYVISFGSFAVADWGWSYEWRREGDEQNGYVWKVIGAQGDPTASGDSFTARRPYFHEALYAGVKGRASAMNAGVLMPIDPQKANDLTNELLSSAEAINKKRIMIEKIQNGEQPHLARFFGVIGAFEKELGQKFLVKDGVKKEIKSCDAWQEGAAVRKKEGKETNNNLKRAVEENILFVPTIFEGKDNKKLVYPMLAPQFPISLFDMLTVSKHTSVGDVLRNSWKKEGDKWVVSPPEEGGKRRTLEDIDWRQYPAYGDDSRAVNDNFISQLYAPLYGTINPKSVEAVVSNPMLALTSIIKSVDIGTRRYYQGYKREIKNPDGTVSADAGKIEKESFEIMYASTILFQNLAFGKFSLIGREASSRFAQMKEQITPGEISDGKSHNIYTSLRSALDILETKGNYKHYSDSFYLMLLAMTNVIEPIALASDIMAARTTARMEEADTTETKGYDKKWRKNINKVERNIFNE